MIGQHKIDTLTFQPRFQLVQHRFLAKIALQEVHPGDALHGQDVQRNHLAAVAQPVAHQLRPAARRRAEVDHGDARLQQAVTLDQFFQFVHRTRTQALGLGFLHKFIVEMFAQPACTAFAAGHGENCRVTN